MAIRILKFILVTIAIMMILMGIFYSLNGSMEMFPTDEQQSKAGIGAMIIIVSGIIIGISGLLIKPKKTG